MKDEFILEFSEDFSNNIIKLDTKKCNKVFAKDTLYEYDTSMCENNNLISEDTLTRTLSIIQTKVFAILSAYRKKFSKEENILRNRKLRAILNDKHMGVHQLVGHWRELTDDAKQRGINDYRDAKETDLVDTIERSYLVAKPDSMSTKEFISIINDCLTIDGETQDSAVINVEGVNDVVATGYYCMYPNANFNKIGFEKNGDKMTLNKIAQAYSQHVKKINLPFVFEGIEIPGSISGARAFKMHNFLY